nr:vacuolar protein sorting-associated protein 9A-like [Ipomoea batatas]GMD45166.1 vacuolar protein sorting-associated protein 9A-like [Ipomoea batatas]
MENADVFGSSTAPLTWHDFLERMRQPSAADFVKAIKSFIVSFSNNAPDPERDSKAVQEFLGNMEAAFRAHSLWAGCSEDELESAGEGLEKYVMTKLFSHVFASHPEDVKVDDQLYEKIALIQQFVRPENLDIKPVFQNEASWLLAQKELQKINMYKAPRDKLVCILNCCKVINNLLINASSSAGENPPGADDFLPVLIYVTIKANPPQLHSNLLYIQRFRHETRLVSEAAYFFTNILSAESFIRNIDAKALSMDETEFESNMQSAQAVLYGLSADSYDIISHNTQNQPGEVVAPKQALNTNNRQASALQPELTIEPSEAKPRNEDQYVKDQPSTDKTPSISDLENKGAAMIMKEDNTDDFFQNFPYFYSQAGVLTVGDVEELLNNYKQLVFKYVCLSKGLGIDVPSPPFSESVAEPEGDETQKDHPTADSDSSGIPITNEHDSESNLLVDEAVTSKKDGEGVDD